MKKRVVITGAAGFIGSHLSETLLDRGYEVIGIDNLLTGDTANIAHLVNRDFTFIKHDVTNYIYVEGPVDFVLHWASPASPIDYLLLPIPTLKVGALGTHKALGLAHAATTQVQSIPLGWRQKLALSVALLHAPRIVFLDEPTSGVDPITRRQFWELIYETAAAGTTVLVTTHYMDEAEYCGRVSIMVDGRIGAMGTPAELKDRFGVHSIDELFVQLARPGGFTPAPPPGAQA